MLLTIDKLNVRFDEDVVGMKKKLKELERLEKEIENSTHYKLLAGKTQMIEKGKGVSQKERSRLVHTTTIAYSVVKITIEKIYDEILKRTPDLDSLEFKEIFEINKQVDIKRGMIMAKAHDIGHVAFGHEGERAINKFVSKINDPIEIQESLSEHKRYFGEEYEKNQGHIIEENDFVLELPSLSFEHNELSAIILNKIIEKGKINLSSEEIQKLTTGVLGHSTSRTPISLLEGDIVAQIVRVADKVEYINVDYDEICTLLNIDLTIESEILKYFQKILKERLDVTTTELTEEIFRRGSINENHSTMRRLKRARGTYEDCIYLYDGTYAESILKDLLKISDDDKAMQKYYEENLGTEVLYPRTVVEQLKKDRDMVKQLINERQYVTEEIDMLVEANERMLMEKIHFKGAFQGENSDRIHFMYQRILNYYYNEHPEKLPNGRINGIVNPIDIKKSEEFEYEVNANQSKWQRVQEYISLFDDKALEQEYDRLVQERIEYGSGYGVEPIRMEEIKKYLHERYEKEVEKILVRENMGTRSIKEARNICSANEKELYIKKTTKQGKNALKENYKNRLKEYQKDYISLQKMYMADEERRREKGEADIIDNESKQGLNNHSTRENTSNNSQVKSQKTRQSEQKELGEN